MIYGLVGLPGHGKSYTAVARFILAAIKENRKVFTNIPLKEEIQNEYPEAQLFSVDIEAMANAENCFDVLAPGAVIILDELWRIWPAGLKADEIPKNQMSFIKEHRHHIDELGREPDIVLVTQDLADIASSIRNMIEITLICCKMVDLGANNQFRVDYYRGFVKGLKGPKDAFIKSDYYKYDEKIFRLYKSHTKTNNAIESVDKKRLVSATIFSGLGFKIAVGFLVVCIVVVIWGVRRTVQGVDVMQNRSKAAALNQPSLPASPAIPGGNKIASSPAVPAVVPAEKTLSERWRIAGFFHIGGQRKIVLISDGSHTFRVDRDKHCNFDGAEYECTIRGELVTRYSGFSESFLLSGISPVADQNYHLAKPK